MKKQIEGVAFKPGGQRDWVQVMCNGGVALQLALLYSISVGIGYDSPFDFSSMYTPTSIGSAYLGALACCNGDTWASELGSVLSKKDPFHVILWKRVPRGTNGGITLVGVAASFVGGAVVGAAYYLGVLLGQYDSILTHVVPPQYNLILVGGVAGIVGSGIDSLLGATLQYSGWNETTRTVSTE
jgi:uncharacterized protein (TIGR00297 family)